MMAAVVSGLHLVGFGILYALLVAQHHQPGVRGRFTLGIGVINFPLDCGHASTPRCDRGPSANPTAELMTPIPSVNAPGTPELVVLVQQ